MDNASAEVGNSPVPALQVYILKPRIYVTMRGGTNLNRQLPVQHVELEPVGEVIGNPLSLALLEASKPFEAMTKR